MEFFGGKCDETYKTGIRKKFCMKNITPKKRITCKEKKNLNTKMSPLDHKICYCEKTTNRCRKKSKTSKKISPKIGKNKDLNIKELSTADEFKIDKNNAGLEDLVR